jgi:hypothetical protein
MNAVPRGGTRKPVRPFSLALLLLTVTGLGYLSGFPGGAGVVVAPAAALVSMLFRSGPWDELAPYAPVPVLLALLLEAAFAPVDFGTEFFAGLAGVAFLVWLADDPARPAGGPLRAFPTIAIPSLALGVAWSSALFLPAGALPIGVAGALLVFAIAAVAILVGRPALFDREEA